MKYSKLVMMGLLAIGLCPPAGRADRRVRHDEIEATLAEEA